MASAAFKSLNIDADYHTKLYTKIGNPFGHLELQRKPVPVPSA